MTNTDRSYRPLVAALLGAVVTGLGHLYLRRWLRALSWVAAGYIAALLFVPQSAVAAVADGGLPVGELAPVLVVAALSVLDAYRVALRDERTATDDGGVAAGEESTATATVDADAADEVDCPACGKTVDPELDFCHWCTTEFDDLTVADADDGDGSVRT
jgi:hypothetical protein